MENADFAEICNLWAHELNVFNQLSLNIKSEKISKSLKPTDEEIDRYLQNARNNFQTAPKNIKYIEHQSNQNDEMKSLKSERNKDSFRAPLNRRGRIRRYRKIARQCKDKLRMSTTNLPHMVTLLPTAMVRVTIGSQKYTFRALLNACAPQTNIAANVVKKMHIPTFTLSDTEYCFIKVSPVFNTICSIEAYAVVKDELPEKSPSRAINNHKQIREQYTNIVLADPEFFRSDEVDIILGVDIYPNIVLPGIIKTNSSLICATNTIFGYVLTGSFLL